jgi:small subunit ribosomal protein S20
MGEIFTLANTTQAKKRVRQSEKRRKHNASERAMTRTSIKRTAKMIKTGLLEESQEAYKKMVPVLDRAATKGLISVKKAARHKKRLSLHLKQHAEATTASVS